MKTRALLIGILLASVLLAAGNRVMAAPDLRLTSFYIEGHLPTTDPDSPLWERTAPVEMPLSGQTVIAPMRFEPFAEKLFVRSLNNGSHIVLLIAWPDATRNDRTVKIDEFRDAVAIQLAGADRPFICMGSVGQRVNILQWKADWQRDIEEGFQDIEHAFPNFWVDVYPYALGGPPYQLPKAFPEVARDYLPGWRVGNPFSQPLKVTPIEETVAQGFGSIATQARQDAQGRGLWRPEGWRVVIARRLNTGDPNDLALSPTVEGGVAFAVWDGASGDVGARKSVSAWAALSIDSPLWQSRLLPLAPVLVVGAIVLSVVFALLIRRRKGM